MIVIPVAITSFLFYGSKSTAPPRMTLTSITAKTIQRIVSSYKTENYLTILEWVFLGDCRYVKFFNLAILLWELAFEHLLKFFTDFK